MDIKSRLTNLMAAGILVGVSLVTSVHPVRATIITYQFDSVGFDGGGTVTGTFQFDTSTASTTSSLLNVNLVSTAFTQADNPAFSTVGAPIRAASFTSGEYFPCAFAGCASYQGGLGGFLFYNNADIFTPKHDYVMLEFLIPATSVPPLDSFSLNMYTFTLGFDGKPIGFAMWDQVASGSVSAVPEPSTWAMMLLGFAGLGVMAYRRKAKLASMAA